MSSQKGLKLTWVWYEMLRILGEQYPIDELPAVLFRLWQTFLALESCSYVRTEHVFWISVLNFTSHRFPCVTCEFIDCFERLATSRTLVGNSMDSVQVRSNSNVRPAQSKNDRTGDLLQSRHIGTSSDALLASGFLHRIPQKVWAG
jgi:hypothetical protein